MTLGRRRKKNHTYCMSLTNTHTHIHKLRVWNVHTAVLTPNPQRCLQRSFLLKVCVAALKQNAGLLTCCRINLGPVRWLPDDIVWSIIEFAWKYYTLLRTTWQTTVANCLETRLRSPLTALRNVIRCSYIKYFPNNNFQITFQSAMFIKVHL